MNRFGGDVYFGVLDDGTVEGIPPKTAPELARNIINNLGNPNLFVSSKRSRFVIEPRRIYTENPCRATRQGQITPENLEPDSKNPIVAAFFRTIGFADELGSGVRKMFEYGKSFAGTNPVLTEGDIFRDELELNSELFNIGGIGEASKSESTVREGVPINESIRNKVLVAVEETSGLNREQLAKALQVDVKTIGRAVAALSGLIEHRGSKKTGGYYLK